MLRLYSDNVITKGFKRDLLMDFGRSKIMLIPKEITRLIESLEEDNDNYSVEQRGIINDLIEEEIIFSLSPAEKDMFPKLELDWEYPGTISNAVIEVGKLSISMLHSVFKQLEKLNCFYYSIILVEKLSGEDLATLDHILAESSITSFELTVNYFKSDKLNEFLIKWLGSARLKNQIVVFNCQDDLFISKFRDNIALQRGAYNKNKCGCIKKQNFNCNLYLYTESQKHNTCLNRKLSVDASGLIKNCLNLPENFGNVRETKIRKVVIDPDFKKYWTIKKDDIKICCDCEFRNICTDCRAFVEDPEDLYSKPLKCGYSPYTNSWEDWSSNPLKEQACTHYGFTEENGDSHV